MRWQEVRDLYPKQFVKFRVLESYIVGTKEYVKDVAVIKVISDGEEAMKEFVNCKPGEIVYNTKNEEVIIQLVENIGIRRSI